MAGLRAAALLATAASAPADAQTFSSLADALLTKYQQSKYAFNSKYDYFNFCALWPARLFPLGSGPISDEFKKTGPQKPDTWLYFPLATAHQSLLAGNREAGYQTIDAFLSDAQMMVRASISLGLWLEVFQLLVVFDVTLVLAAPFCGRCCILHNETHGWGFEHQGLLARKVLRNVLSNVFVITHGYLRIHLYFLPGIVSESFKV